MRGNFITDRRGIQNHRYIDGRKNTRLYSIYRNMLSRCYNKNTSHYLRYGGRGIKVCDEWLSDFKNFYNWSINNGYSNDLTIDRRNNDLDYCPDNCRWVSIKTQCRNTSRNHMVTINNETKTLIEWSEIYNINYKTLRDRLKRGWSHEKSLTTPVDTRFRRKKVV